MKRYFFLSGIARSGSTLLGSILNQNPDIYVSPTSPLLDLFCLVESSLQKLNQQYTFDFGSVNPDIHAGLCDSFYKNVSKKYIIDKHRAWPKNVNAIRATITDQPRIICTYRPIAENIVSFLKLMRNDPDNIVDRQLQANGLPLSTRNRAMFLWEHYSSDPWMSLKIGLDNYRDCLHLVKYDNLVRQPEIELAKIYDFLEIPRYDQHYFRDIKNTCSEQKDDMWGFQGLHDIHAELKKTSDDPVSVLGKELADYFKQFDDQLKVVI